jgi:hypothetical protein
MSTSTKRSSRKRKGVGSQSLRTAKRGWKDNYEMSYAGKEVDKVVGDDEQDEEEDEYHDDDEYLHDEQGYEENDYVNVTDGPQQDDITPEQKQAMAEAEVRAVARHRAAFMERAFPPVTAERRQPVSHQVAISQMGKVRSKEDFDRIVNVVQNWRREIKLKEMDPGYEKQRLSAFRAKHKTEAKLARQYVVEMIQVPGSLPRPVLRRLERNKQGIEVPGRIVVNQETAFDAIDEWHRGMVHQGQVSTWTYCQDKFYNVTQELVMHYCKTCVSCLKKHAPVTDPVRGSVKPIRSVAFRERFQIDLIDFRKLRKRDPFGLLMRWIMTLKDHATGFIYLCALPRKRANLVAYKLQEIFGVIGYPKIFHTDNGKEFTGKVVLKFLRMLNPNILAVTGRARRPQDQGSVESMNKFVKRNIGAVLAERRSQGENPNWTEILGSVAAVVNSHHGRGKNDISAYEAVYGQEPDHQFLCTKEEARRCWTIKDRLQVTNDPEFEKCARAHFVIPSDGEQDNHPNAVVEEENNEEADDYFSNDELDSNEKDEVDDEYFFSQLQHELDEDNNEEIEDITTDDGVPIFDDDDAIGRGEQYHDIFDKEGIEHDEDAISEEEVGEDFDAGENLEQSQGVADDAFIDLFHEQSQQLQDVTDVSPIRQVCHWSFNEKCFCTNFTPNRCEYPACNNYAHLRCMVMWVKENRREDYIKNYKE